jgi:isopentenyl phosphate kinase
VDVTGGMRSKVELMWGLVRAAPGMTVQLVGPEPGLVARALLGRADGEGTLIGA